jgi:2,4-dienoyl-CoA reductase-like NADH-dependent reductase (Old Yellow Enzyme family)/thioredoxin reductase
MARQASFPYLLAPGHIGKLELRNRIIVASMGENLAEPDGFMGERIQRFYEERAKGGAALIIIGVAGVAHPAGTSNVNQVGISDDKFIPKLKQFADRIHAQGAKVALQLHHGGKVARMDIPGGRARLVPSEYVEDGGDLLTHLTDDEAATLTASMLQPGAVFDFHPMTTDDIKALIGRFADAAERAKRAGVDGVEIHGAHGYIISSFISPKTNKRTDEYGGSIENRARLLTEVIKAVRARVGNDFPVWCRLDGKEIMVDGGITEETAQQTAMLAEAAGADAIHVSVYGNPSKTAAFTRGMLIHERCGLVGFAEGIKKKVKIPVITVGRIEPEDGDRLIREGKADFIAMARKMVADPELPAKLADGHPEDIRPCICCYSCVGEIFLNRPVLCAANPLAGREYEVSVEPTKHKRRVLVVGGGPAGMEAARLAALRGHEVTLCEKGERLGGTLFFASILSPDNERLLHWIEAQVAKLPIAVRLNTEVNAALVKEIEPDVVIVAVGAKRELPEIPGVRSRHVMGGDDMRALMTGGDNKEAKEKLSFVQRTVLNLGKATGMTGDISSVREMSKHWMPLGKRVAVVGGGLVGLELALFLAERNRDVTLLEEGRKLATELAIPRRWHLLHELRESSVKVLMQTNVESIETTEITCVAKDGQKSTIEIDSVIIAKGAKENHALGESLAGSACEVHLVGDCESVEYIKGAIRKGFEVGCSI